MNAIRPALWSLLIYACLALAVLGSALMNLDTVAIGSVGADAHKHIWSQWWVWHSLVTGDGIPFRNQMIFFPDGGPFFSLDTANTVLSIPLRPFFSPLVVYNLLYLVHLIAGAWACWWLARECEIDAESSLIAGTVGIFCAWVLSFPIASGVSETMAFFPLPLVWLFGIRLLRRPGWKAPVLCAVLLLLQAAFCWSYAIIASVGLAALGIGWLVHRPWRFDSDADWVLDKAVLQRLALAMGLVAMVVLPLYLAIAGTVQAEDAVYTRSLSIWPGSDTPNPLVELAETNNTPLVDFVLPGQAGLRISTEGVERLFYGAYAGVLGLLAFGLGLAKGGRRVRYVGLATLLFFLLSLGPIIDFDHDRTGPHLPNPIHLLHYYVFPLFSATIHSTDRLLLGFQICLGIGAAFGIQHVVRGIAPGRRRWAVMAISVAMVLELLWISPAPWQTPTTPTVPHVASERLARQPGTGAVLDLPFYDSRTGQFIGDIFYQQTVHGRPVPFRLDGMNEQVVSPSLRDNGFYRALESELSGHTRNRGASCADLVALGSLGFDAVVVRTDRLTGEQSEAISNLLGECVGELESVGEARIAWLDGISR